MYMDSVNDQLDNCEKPLQHNLSENRKHRIPDRT